MKSHRTMTCLVLGVFLAMGTFAVAQEPPPGPMDGPQEDAFYGGQPRGGMPGGPPTEERREEIRRKVEAVRIWRLTEELKLDEKTASKFLPVLSSLDTEQKALARENQNAMRELRTYLDSPDPDEAKLKGMLEKLEQNMDRMEELRDKEFKAARDFLTVEQQARYVVFKSDFRREMRNIISRARRGRGMDGGRSRPGGPMRPRMPMDGGYGSPYPPTER